MKKGRFGIILSFYAVVAFILAMLGQTLMCLLLLGFVLVAEGDQWLTRQCIQALILTACVALVNSVFSLFDILHFIPYLGYFLSVLVDILSSMLSVALVILCIFAITKVIKEADANIPLASKFAGWACGVAEQKITPPEAPVQPQNQPPSPLDKNE